MIIESFHIKYFSIVRVLFRWYIFFLGNGTFVKGEVYEVDDIVLGKLDILEEHPDYYTRDLYNVVPLNDPKNVVQVWIYVIRDFKVELLNQPFYETYSSFGSHGRKYVERYLRGDTYDYKVEILSSFRI